MLSGGEGKSGKIAFALIFKVGKKRPYAAYFVVKLYSSAFENRHEGCRFGVFYADVPIVVGSVIVTGLIVPVSLIDGVKRSVRFDCSVTFSFAAHAERVDKDYFAREVDILFKLPLFVVESFVLIFFYGRL